MSKYTLQNILEKYNINTDSIQKSIIKNKLKKYNDEVKNCKNLDEILVLLHQLRSEKKVDIEHVNIALYSLLELYKKQYLIKNELQDATQKILMLASEFGLALNEKTYGIQIEGLFLIDRPNEALMILESADMLINPTTLYDVFLNSCINYDCDNLFVKATAMMRVKMIKPDKITHSIILNFYKKHQDHAAIVELIDWILAFGSNTIDTQLYNNFIDSLSSSFQHQSKAIALFEEMSNYKIKRNVATYNAMIKLHGNARRVREILILFERMHKERVAPDIITYNSMINFFGKEKKVAEAETIIDVMNKDKKVLPDIRTYNIILNLYAKNNYPQKFLLTLENLRLKKVVFSQVTYGIIADFYCKKQDIHKIDELLEEMELKGATPDVRIYSSIMHMYANAGRFIDAKSVSEIVVKKFGGLNFVIICLLMEIAAKQNNELEVNRVYQMARSSKEFQKASKQITGSYLDAIFILSLKGGDIEGFYQKSIACYEECLKQLYQVKRGELLNCHGMTPGSFAMLIISLKKSGMLLSAQLDIGKEKRSKGDKNHRLSFVPSLLGFDYNYDVEKGVVSFY